MAEIELLLDSPNKVIIAVDFNTKQHSWNSQSNNAADNLLFEYLNSRHDVTIADSDSPTHYQDNFHHSLDIFEITIALMKTKGTAFNIENLSSEL